MEKQRPLMERRWEGGEQERMMHREDLRNQWQPASRLDSPEKRGDTLRSKSYAELEEWARQRYHHSLPRRRRLQGEMWRDIQNALKTEWISGSLGRSIRAEPCQIPSSENKFNLNQLISHLPPSYKESKALRFSWSRPPDYTPPPRYSPRSNSTMPTGMMPTPRSPNLSKEHSFESRQQSERQTEHCSAIFLDRRAGTMTFPCSNRTQHLQEIWPSNPNQTQKQQQIFTPQSSGHHVEEKSQGSYSDMTQTKPKRRKRSGGTVFCLVSHTGELTGLSSSPNDQPPTSETFPLLKSSTFTETQEQVQLADRDDSCSLLNSFSLDRTPEGPKEEDQNQSDRTVRIPHHREELRKEREEPKEHSNERRRVIDLSKKKHDTDFDKNMDNVTPAASSKSTRPGEPHQQTTLKFPLWKEPKSKHGSNIPKKDSAVNRSVSRESQYEQSEARNNTKVNENSSLVIIDATCVVIKLEFMFPPEREHVQYVSIDSNHHHKTTDQTTERRSEHKLINRERHTSGHQFHDTLEGSAEAESECCLKVMCEKAEILKASTPNKEAETPDSFPATEAISKVTDKDAVNVSPGLEIMAKIKNRKQENKVNSAGRKFILEERIPTDVMDIKVNQVKDSFDGHPSGQHENLQNLQQTILKPKKREDETDMRQNFNQVSGGGAAENANQTFSQEYTLTQWSSSTIKGDHVGDTNYLLDEATDLENPSSVPVNSYESKHWTTEERQSNTLHNMQTTSEMFGLKGSQHQKDLLNVQNLCSNLLSTPETVHQETGQNLSYSEYHQGPPPFIGHHVENTNESFSHEEHLSDVCPNLLHSAMLKISDKFFHEDIQRENRPSHAKHDANDCSQSFYGNNMETWSESHDHEDALCEGNMSGDVTHLQISCSVKDISEPCDEASHFHEDRVELLNSVLLGEDVHQGGYCLYEGDLTETTNIKIFSHETSWNIVEAPESFQDEVYLAKVVLLDDLQNNNPVLVGSSMENAEDNEGVTSPSPGLHMLSEEELTSTLLFTPPTEISPYPSDCVSSTCAEVCSSVASAREHIIVKQCPQSLWDVMRRIRKHTAPDSETEEEDGEFWDSAENTEDSLFLLSENAKSKEEESSGLVLSKEKGEVMEGERHLGDDDNDGDDDSVSSSSVGSQDTVIEGEGKRKFL